MSKSKKYDLKKFNIEMLKDIGGCKPAMVYLREKYGKKEANLADHKEDVIQLLDEGKADWIIHFSLSIMPDKEKLYYLEYIMDDFYRYYDCEEYWKPILEAILQHYRKEAFHDKKLNGFVNILKEHNENIIEKKKSSYFELAQYARNKALLQLLLKRDRENFVPHFVLASCNFVEALSFKNLSEDELFPYDIYQTQKLKDYGLYAMTLSKVWPIE